MHVEPGATIVEQYRVLGHLVDGGSAGIWKAVDEYTKKDVAIKSYTDKPSMEQEVRMLSLCSHPVQRGVCGDACVGHYPTHRLVLLTQRVGGCASLCRKVAA